MPKIAAIDLSVRPLPKEIAERYGRLPEYRHVWEHMFKRPEVLRDGVSLEDMRAEMDRWNIEYAAVSGYDARKTNGLYVENDWVASSLNKAMPKRIIQGIGIDPTRDIMENLAEIDRCVKLHNPKLVRLFPYAADLAPDDRRYYPIYAKCIEHKLAIWTQVGHTAGLMPSEPGRPIYLDRVALDFPELRIIGGHIGWPWTQEMIAMAVKHPHVYISTCAHAPDHWPTELLPFMKTRGKRKVLFASNWPYVGYDRYFQKFDELGLSDEVEELFLRQNAITALRLSEEGL